MNEGTPRRVWDRTSTDIALGVILALAVVATLTVALALGLYAHPQGDDFCHAANVREAGLVGCVYTDYNQWGGRWASTALACAFPWLLDVTQWYPLPLLAILCALLLALRLLLTEVLQLRDRRGLAWSLSLVLLALYWAGLAHPGQSVYWLEGAWVYSLNLSLGMALLAGLLRLPTSPSARRSLGAGGLALLGFVVAAFHELFALVLIGLLIAGTGLAFRWRDERRSAWSLVTVATLLGLATVLVAPGNEARQAHPTGAVQGGDPVRALVASVVMTLRILDAPSLREAIGSASPLGWVLDAKLLAATFLLALAPSLHSLRPDWLEREPWLWRLLVPGACLVFLAGSFLAGGWALGRTLPLRAFNGLYLVFLIGWLLTAFVYTRDASTAGGAGGSLFLRTLCVLVLALGLVSSTNTKLGLRDLARGRAAAFDREMERRYAAVPEARQRGGTLVAVRVDPWPSSYFEFDIDSISDFNRQCIERHFGLSSITIRD